jgi:hypothetical protein
MFLVSVFSLIQTEAVHFRNIVVVNLALSDIFVALAMPLTVRLRT